MNFNKSTNTVRRKKWSLSKDVSRGDISDVGEARPSKLLSHRGKKSPNELQANRGDLRNAY